MPELPEVERAVRLLRAAIEAQALVRARVFHPSLRRRLRRGALRALSGGHVAAVERRGKHQLIRFEDGRILHVHFRMNGDWIIGSTSDPLPRFARAAFDFANGTRVVLEDSRALSTLDVHPAGAELGLDLGPEPSDPALTTESLRSALSRRRAPIKVALLDQRVIAGVGNIYASESLWRAKIDPRTSAASLTSRRIDTLLTAVRAVIDRATGGRYAQRESGRLDVYDREGRACRRCGTTIERIVQSGRSTYFCPRCQHSAKSPRKAIGVRRARSRTSASHGAKERS